MIAQHRQPAAELTARHLTAVTPATTHDTGLATRVYNLAAVPVPGAGSEAGRAILTLQRYQPIVEYVQWRLGRGSEVVRSNEQLDSDAQALSRTCGLAPDKVRRLLPEDARQTDSLTRPFVIRAARGELIELHVANHLSGPLWLALIDDDYGIQHGVAHQRPLDPGERGVVLLACKQTGIFPIYNQACPQTVANHCLLGVLMIEP